MHHASIGVLLMKKLALVLSSVAIGFAVLVGILFYAFYPGDLTNPDVFSKYTRQQIDNKFPINIEAASLVGQEVLVIDFTDRSELLTLEETLVALQSRRSSLIGMMGGNYRPIMDAALPSFRLESPDSFHSERYQLDADRCYGFNGGKLSVRDHFEGRLLVRYTASSTPMSLIAPIAYTVRECPNNSVLQMSVEDFQRLHREHFLREHYDATYARLTAEAEAKRDKELREKMNRALR
jgi:hypothetical protein